MKRRAFSLLEILIVVAILSMVVFAMWAVVSAGTTAGEREMALVDGNFRLRLVLDQIVEEVHESNAGLVRVVPFQESGPVGQKNSFLVAIPTARDFSGAFRSVQAIPSWQALIVYAPYDGALYRYRVEGNAAARFLVAGENPPIAVTGDTLLLDGQAVSRGQGQRVLDKLTGMTASRDGSALVLDLAVSGHELARQRMSMGTSGTARNDAGAQ